MLSSFAASAKNCGTREERFPISTRRLVVGKGRWQVELAFRNETHATLTVMRPHIQGGTYFGLEPFETTSQREVLERADRLAAKPPTIADRFSPTLPRILPPGTGWSGRFSGEATLPARTPIRVVLGRFVVAGKPRPELPNGFLCISARFVRLR